MSATRIAALNTELTQLNTALEVRVKQRTRELEASNQELEAFSYSVSHDLRAPLRTIDGFSLALLEDFSDKLNDEGRDYIARVRSGVQRMGTLIDALLQLSRVTRSELQADAADLSQLATLVFHELEASDRGRSVTFEAEPHVLVHGDPRLLRIALENLIGNAWKFTSKTEHARIEFGTRPATGDEAGDTVYFIRDNGAGFDMNYVDRLFTAFQRLHGDRDFKGSGIGLATVSRIIRRHHGMIGATGEPGRGATFYFTLPPRGDEAPVSST
jgi:light-regulated signal transduction histidine kinase (bacteriophytochrome)